MKSWKRRAIDWELDDSKDQSIKKVREIRDENKKRVMRLIERLTGYEN